MCVETKNQAWERPAAAEDIPILAKYFPKINFKSMLEAMSVDGCVPLTSDLILFAGILSADEDELGMRFLPFAGISSKTPQTMVKLSVMDGIVEWMENTALGSYMWRAGSDWAEKEYACRVEFTMNCGCGCVCSKSYKNGDWTKWVRRFNESRQDVYGRTNIVWQSTIEDTDITQNQFYLWRRMRAALEALPFKNKMEASSITAFLEACAF